MAPELDKLHERLSTMSDPIGFLVGLFANAPVGIQIFQADGHCLLTNRAFRQQFGPPAEYSVDIAANIVPELVQRAFAGETVRTSMIWHDPPELAQATVTEKRKEPAGCTFFPVPGRNGKIEYVAAIFERRTETQPVEERGAKLNAELERKVADRTHELATVNRDLEAFTYSVSHDLRAPLRAINGFGRVLMDDHGSQLDKEGLHCLKRILAAADSMRQLIDDLLSFSCLGRQQLSMGLVQPREIIKRAVADLVQERLGREAEISMGHLPTCLADAGLLKQVFVNLIGNALKFTRDRPTARIQIGCREIDGLSVWFVKDNGVGFDMQYANRLFHVFERLHRAEDYEGTGVGLALVHRIVERHGGRVWAESEPDQGATFYFTLGEASNGH